MLHPTLQAQLEQLGLDEKTPPTPAQWTQLLALLNHHYYTTPTEQTLQKRIQFEALITSISTYFINLTSQEIDAGIIRALRQISEFADVVRSYVFLLSDDGRTVSNTHEWYALTTHPGSHKWQNIPVDSIPWWMSRLHHLETIHIQSVADLPAEAQAEKELLQGEHIQSALVVPMAYGRKLVGFLGFESEQAPHRWDEESISLLRIVGEIFVNALHHKQAEAELAQQAAELAALYRASTQLFAGGTLGKLAQQIARAVTKELEFTDCSVLILDRPIPIHNHSPIPLANKLTRMAQSGKYTHKSSAKIALDGPGLIPAAVRTGQVIYAPDVREDPRYLQGDSETRSEFAVPLHANNQIIGALDFQSPKCNAFDERARRLINVFAEHAGLALENARLYQELGPVNSNQ